MLLFCLFQTYKLSEGPPPITSQNLAKIPKRSAILSDDNPAPKSKHPLLYWDLYMALQKHFSFWLVSSQTNKTSVTNDLLSSPERNPDLFFRTVFIFISERSDKDTLPFKESDEATAMFGKESHSTWVFLSFCLIAFGKGRRYKEKVIKIWSTMVRLS